LYLNLKGYFKKLGADLVLDIKLAEDLALLESQNEFIERYKSAKASKNQKILPMLASSCPGKVIKSNIMIILCPIREYTVCMATHIPPQYYILCCASTKFSMVASITIDGNFQQCLAA